MNIGLHQFAKRIINHLMALYATISAKFRRYDGDIIMTFAVFGPRMACMQMTLVLYQQLRRCKLCRKRLADQVWPIPAHGNTFLKGFTITLA